MIKFIENSAVYDVSRKMREELCETLSKTDESVFLIVPDQFEFETEKTIYSDLKKSGLLTELCRVNVTTFTSLSRKILESEGENMPPADDTVKNVIMNKAVREQKNLLSALGSVADKAGFCRKMVDTVGQLKAAGLKAEDLCDEGGLLMSENNGMSTVIRKLSDVGKIFASYDNFLSKYADSLDYTKKASKIISDKDNNFFEGSSVFVDCFNDFTGSQMEFIRRMIPKAKNVVFSFVTGTKEDRRANVFDRTRSQRDRICSYAESENIEVETLTENLSKRLCGPIGELSEKLFGNTKSEEDPNGCCELVSARGVYEEADYTAAKIKELCLDKGFLYRDIAVLCADAENGKYIRDAFEKYEIPFFLDIPEPILYRPLVNFFITLLKAVINFTEDNVLICLKTGFYCKRTDDDISAISNKEIDTFENYIFEWNLSAKHLKKEFTFGGENNFNRLQAETIRKAVAVPILELREELKNKDGAGITRALYDFAVNKADIERALHSRCYDRNGNFDKEAVDINQQVWNSLVEIFSVLEEELSGENISLEGYYRLFSDICSQTSLAKPPQYRDCVLVGDIGRTRAGNIKAAFIVGASYEKIPEVSSGMGIFSEYEAELVTNLIRENTTGDDIRARSLKDMKEQYSLSLYRVYRAVSLPTEFLSVSCPEYDSSGNNISRSTIFGDIKRVFPNIKTIKAEELDDLFYCRSIKATKQRYAQSLRKNTKSYAAMRAYLENSGNADFVKKLDEIKDKRGPGKSDMFKMSKNSAKQLFKNSLAKNGNIAIGATQIEKLMLCPFSFFCTKELGIREINKREFNNLSRGNAMHYIMQKVFEKYKGKTDKFLKLGNRELLKLSRDYLFEFLKLNTNGDTEDDKRTMFLFSNIATSAADLLLTIQTELSVRQYYPQFFEMNISEESENKVELSTAKESGFTLFSKPIAVDLSDDTKVHIGGKLDRLDAMYAEKDGRPRMYLRVIDYKSSGKSFDKNNAKSGVNVQMLLYLTALCKANSENETIDVVPGEISYINSKNAGSAKSRQEALYLLEMNYRPEGLYINDEIIESDLKKLNDKLISCIQIDDEEKKQKIAEEISGSFSLNEYNSVTADEFKTLSEECISNITEKLKQIYNGDVSAIPLTLPEKNSKDKKNDQPDPCKYCEFGDICQNSTSKS